MNQHPLGLAVGDITEATLSEAAGDPQPLPTRGAITGAAKAGRIHKSLHQQEGMPIVAFPVLTQASEIES
jgi:hypothetical protein